MWRYKCLGFGRGTLCTASGCKQGYPHYPHVVERPNTRKHLHESNIFKHIFFYCYTLYNIIYTLNHIETWFAEVVLRSTHCLVVGLSMNWPRQDDEEGKEKSLRGMVQREQGEVWWAPEKENLWKSTPKLPPGAANNDDFLRANRF